MNNLILIMALGFLCKKCGWQETNHDAGMVLGEGDPNVRLEGYNASLNECEGYTPPDLEVQTKKKGSQESRILL